jgi:hypothetical protein
MLDVLKSMSGGPWNWLVGWMFPSLIACSATGFLLIPRHPRIPLPKDAGDRTLLLIGISLLVALLLSSLGTILYRVLEGYAVLPKWIGSKWSAGQLRRRNALREQIEQANPHSNAASIPGASINIALTAGRLARYPAADGEVGPTRLGNAIRAFETYGYDRYQLDSLSLWSELTCLVPDALRQEEMNAKAPIDFFVSLVWLAPCYAVLAAASLVEAGFDGWVSGSVVLALVAVPVCYRLAVVASDRWASSVRAIVNVGRLPLAERLGFDVPRSIVSERRLWQAISWFVTENYDESYSRDLTPFRKRVTAPGQPSRPK